MNVTDILPDGLVLEDYTASKGTYSNGIWKIGDLKANEKTGIYVKTKIIKTGEIINSAYAISAENDTDMSNNNASHTITVEPTIDLAISKKANKTNPNYGDSVKWTIIITNKGIDKATNVTIKDILPAGLILSDGSHEYQLFVGNLNVNQSFTTEIITYVNATGIIKNTASVSGSEYDIDLSNNEISESISVGKATDLEIKKTASNANPKLNDSVDWTITVKNNGPNDATNVIITDILPSGLNYVSSTPSKGRYSNSVWNIDSLNINEIAALTITTKISKTGLIINAANVTSDEFDIDKSNNNDNYGINVSPASDLSIVKSVNNSNPNYGDLVKWRVTVTNNGPDTAHNVSAVDCLPEGLVIVNGNTNYFAESLGALKSVSFDFVTLVNKTGLLINRVNVTGSEFDYNLANNNASSSVNVAPASDLAVVKSVNNSSPCYGDLVTWTVAVTNNGPDVAHNVSISDVLPVGLVIVRGNTNHFVESLGVLESVSFDYVTLVNKTGMIVNTVNVTSDEYDFNKSNNRDNSSINVSPASDLAVVKIANNSHPNYGDLVKWTVTVINYGPDTAHNISVVDSLPEGLVIINGNTNYFAESLGALKSVSFDFVTLVNKTGLLINRVNVTCSEFDYNLTNNNASSSVNVLPASDLAVVKSVNNSAPYYGDLVKWTVAVTNNGPDTAHNVSISDVLLDGLVIVSGNANHFIDSLGVLESVSFDFVTLVNKTGLIVNTVNVTSDEHDFNKSNNRDNCSINVSPASDLAVVKLVNNSSPSYNDLVKWTVAVTNYGPDIAHNVSISDVLPEGLVIINGNTNYFVESLGVLESVSFDFVTLVNKTGLLINRVNVTGSEFDYNLTNNNAFALVNVLSASDLAVVKSVNNSHPNYGDLVAWTVTVTNNGPNIAHNVSISDMLPEGLVVISGKPNQFIESLGVLESVSFDYVTLVNKTGLIVNAVNVTSDEYDFNKSNNWDNCSIDVSPASDLGVVKSVNNSHPNYGDLITWTVVVTNYGPDICHNITVSDVLPEGLVIISGTTDYFVESLCVLDSVSFDFVTLVNKTGSFINNVNVNGSEFDYNLDNNNATCTVNVSPACDLEIIKSVNDTNPNYLDNIKWIITLTNNGPDTASNVRVNEILPSSLKLISYDASKGYFEDNTWIIDELAINNQVYLEITTQVVQTGNITNIVNVFSDEYDYNPSNNAANKTVSVNPAIDLKVTKTVNNTAPNYNELINWTITVTNNGPDKANNIEIIDKLPEGLLLVNYTATKGYYDEGVWKYCCVEVGEIVTLEITTKVVRTGEFTNNVSGSADEYDYNKSNNYDSQSINVLKASNLQIIKSVNQSEVNYHDLVKWTLIVRNNGPDDATNVVVNEALPYGLTLISTSDENYSNGIWYVGNIAAGQSKQLEIITRVDATGTINNIVNVTGDQYDEDPTDNNDNKSIEIPPVADLSIVKTASNQKYNAGELIEYVIEISNNGPDTAENITVNEILEGSLTLDSVIVSSGYYDYVNNVWNIESLGNGEKARLIVKAIAEKEGFVSNKVNVSSNTIDDNLNNNYGECIVEIVKKSANITKSGASTVKSKLTKSNVKSGGLNNAANHRVELKSTGIPISLLIFISLISLAFCNINILKKR